MKNSNLNYRAFGTVTRVAWMLAVLILMLTPRLGSAGTWVQLATNAPGPVQLMLLLSDGTVMCSDGGNGAWFKLIPDSTGSYINGTWTTLKPMNYTRRYFSSALLRDGRVFVAGAEYGTGTTNAEIYDPLADQWTVLTVPPGLITTNNTLNSQGGNQAGFSDSGAIILPGGSVLIAPVYPAPGVGTVSYNPFANSWTNNGVPANQNEATWVKLPDDSILTIDTSSTSSERFIPSLNQWIADSNAPVNLYGVGAEMGPGFLLFNKSAFFLGGNNNTAIYTPSGTTNPGTWSAGLPIPNGQACPDAPGAMMANGRILFACNPPGFGTNTFIKGVSFYEYNPFANSYTSQAGPTNWLVATNISAYQTAMLCLPDGNVLFSDEGNRPYVYIPDCCPIASGTPAINSVTWGPGGSLHLTGTLFNGISQGASYGDDEQMDSNYAIARFGDGDGHLYYGRTYDWSDTGVMTGGKLVTTEVNPPWGLLTSGPYPLTVVANGNPSAPFMLNAPVWVDYNYNMPFSQIGSYLLPFALLADARDNVAPGGTVAIKPGSSPETLTITKPMTIVAVGGDVTIGR